MIGITGASGPLGRATAKLVLRAVDPRKVVLTTRTPEALADLASRGAQVRQAAPRIERRLRSGPARLRPVQVGGPAPPLVGLATAHSAIPMATVMTALGLAALTVLITVAPDETGTDVYRLARTRTRTRTRAEHAEGR